MTCSSAITKPKGFLASGVACGIKKSHKDLALIYSTVPAAAAGVFTTNKVKAAPILVTQEHLKHKQLQAVVVNSGNANACVGFQGIEDAREMARLTAEGLGIDMHKVGVCSTGVIGVPLQMDAIRRGILAAINSLSPMGGTDAAEAILTTDTCRKEAFTFLNLGSSQACIGAMAKGSGMIHPNMATMLAFITTDARIDPNALDKALRLAVDGSFHLLSVDGETSTNDSVIIMANGLAENDTIFEGSEEFYHFCDMLTSVCIALAKEIARDGEGASKLLSARVKGARTIEDARRMAVAIVKSNLVKCAVFGCDPNWGRILCAMGYSGADFDPSKVELWLGPIQVVRNGSACDFDEGSAKEVLGEREVTITVDLRMGEAEATAWGCDLTYDYVRINASYRT